ncbi:DNA-binding winged helix-turn-helix (wHTH) protein [Nitrobacteraceae bacterium AZCC 1564]
MTLKFGPFELDEPRRALLLQGRELSLQPRIFDLLIYLINARTRVVSKDELLDAVWGGVTVTDNSLQRAISTLRTILREGGMESAVRNFPRNGYRFCVELDERTPSPQSELAPDASSLSAARQAAAERRWQDAVAQYEQADGEASLTGEDLDRWSLALQCVGKPSDAIPLLVRAVAEHTKAGRPDLAATSAVTLSTIHGERGEMAVSKGWLARGQDLAADAPDCRAIGQILWMESRIAAVEAHPHEALRKADAAYKFGRDHGYIEIESLGLMYRGFFQLSLGDTDSGLADQDHAAALALSRNIDPLTGGTLYCNILWACRTFGDWARANQWTLGYQQFCSKSRMEFAGSCQLHRAEVLGIQGTLADAVEHISDALSRLTGDAPWAVGDAYRVLGDIRSAMGDEDEALVAYERSYALGWDPQPGHAMLLLERGHFDAAYLSLERSLIGESWWTLQRQGILLGHLAVVAARSGKHERARAIVDDLTGQAHRWPMASIRALTNEACGYLEYKRDPKKALDYFHLSRQLWTSVDSHINATRLRLRLAELQLRLGDKTGAAHEIRAAMAAAKEHGAKKLLKQASALLAA